MNTELKDLLETHAQVFKHSINMNKLDLSMLLNAFDLGFICGLRKEKHRKAKVRLLKLMLKAIDEIEKGGKSPPESLWPLMDMKVIRSLKMTPVLKCATISPGFWIRDT